MRKDEFEWIITESGETVLVSEATSEKLMRACERELRYLLSCEDALCEKAIKAPSGAWLTVIEKLPPKTQYTLSSAFSKAFRSFIMSDSSIIDRIFDRNEALKDYLIGDYAVKVKGTHKQLKRMRKGASGADGLNTAITTASGVGLGLFGVGMPDIVSFVSLVLKGIYEKVAYYGHDHLDMKERYFILKMIEAALTRGPDRLRMDREVDDLMFSEYTPSEEEMEDQILRTSDACAIYMTVTRFIQGIPVVGGFGGIGNPFYYGKILKYVKLKYQKRYVLELMKK